MADAPKMLTAEQLADYRRKANGSSGSAAGWWDEDINELLSHIAALDGRIAALEKAGDAIVVALAGDNTDQTTCTCEHCGGLWCEGEEEDHEQFCPVPAWRAVRENADG